MSLFFVVFFLLVILTLFKSDDKKTGLFFLSALLLFLFAAFRESGIDRDYLGYIEYYNDILDKSFSRVEPSFVFITHLSDKVFANNLFLFIIYAFLGVSLKFIAINKLTEYKQITVLIYFSYFFLLFEMTQIRAGVAAGFMLLSIIKIQEKKIGQFLIYVLLASLFHYSAIILAPLYYLKGDKINIQLYSLLIPIGYLLYYLPINLFFFVEFIPINLIQIKLESYQNLASIDSMINVFNLVHLSRIVLAGFFLWKWKLIAQSNIYGVILIKIYIIALFVFVAFAKIPTISSRISELLLVVEIILIPFIYVIFKPKYLSKAIIISIGFSFLLFSFYYTRLFIF